MGYSLNTTDNYHINNLTSLGWELTVCNALYPENSPCRGVLQTKNSFGVQLYRFLEKLIPFNEIHNILEIGGGLGYLMRDFLSLNRRLKATMLDISPYLLEKQKENLKGFEIDFYENDILQIKINDLAPFDLIIMNENLGDLPTLVAHTEENIGHTEELAYYLEKASYLSTKYKMPFAEEENINIGAMVLLENICQAGVKYIYLSEHSCESRVPERLKSYINIESSEIPEKIPLKGHDEYTIKFSYLQKIAEMFHYRVRRGPIANFLPWKINNKVLTALRLVTPFTSEQEIIRQFVYDLYKYEYMILIKGKNRRN
ncbi:MAG: class I SAM-dependent methyltransferase [Smithellaceae bacterium]|jgi:SAM-dependent methyltransferase